MNRMPAELPQERVVVIIGTREQCPLDLAPLRSTIGTLATGDYSVRGLEHVVAIERKPEGDLLACIGQEREWFDREVQRLLAYPVRALVIESTWQRIEAGQWRSKITPSAALAVCSGGSPRGCGWSWQATTNERGGMSHGCSTSRPVAVGVRPGRWCKRTSMARSSEPPRPRRRRSAAVTG
ncbi:MAG TPA: hypothetical protein VHZ24_03620 [Pirellulales bacterium]|jgi:hypothetical protein|nr:hypothetical protein [Pirellulales bacterium]